MAQQTKQLEGRDILQQAATARGTGRSQGTVIEQSRAIAEVQGALLVADRRPRDEQRALESAIESCKTQDVASAAFFKFPRGGETVSGPTIHLARELARCWGNIVYAVVELDRDDDRHLSEMMAYAWDLETNTRSQTQFLVPHKRDTRRGAQLLAEMRDIYENNANMGARRLRECIFAVLPPYLTKAAERRCHETLQSGLDEKPLPVRINEAVVAFEKMGVGRDRIEARMGPIAGFTAVDYANLRVSYGSLQRREVSPEEEFPPVAKGLSAETIAEATKPALEGPPAGTTLGEEIDDAIPALEKDKPNRFYRQKEEPAQGAGMTEVDEDTARQLDAGGAAEERQESENPAPATPDEEESADERILRETRAKISAASSVKSIEVVDSEWAQKFRNIFDDAVANEVDQEINRRRIALREKEQAGRAARK